jgi:hypothetical protein
VFDNVRWAFRIKTNRGRGGVVENVHLSQLVIHRPADAAFDISGVADSGVAVGPPESTPVLRDVVCSDMVISDAKAAGVIRGLPESWFQNITLRNMSVHKVQTGIRCENVSGLVLDGITVAPGAGPALDVKNAIGLEVNELRVDRMAAGAPVIALEAVHNALIASCRTPADTKVFVALAGAANNGVLLMNNAIPIGATATGRGLVLRR